MRNIQCNHEEVSAFFMKLLNVLQVSEPVWSMDDMFTIDGEQRAAEAAALGVPLLSQCGNKESKSSKSEPDYKLEHLETFAQYDLLWPPVLSSSPDIQFVGMLPREKEVAVFLHTVFPMPSNAHIQCCDINPTLARILHAQSSEGERGGP